MWCFDIRCCIRVWMFGVEFWILFNVVLFNKFLWISRLKGLFVLFSLNLNLLLRISVRVLFSFKFFLVKLLLILLMIWIIFINMFVFIIGMYKMFWVLKLLFLLNLLVKCRWGWMFWSSVGLYGLLIIIVFCDRVI